MAKLMVIPWFLRFNDYANMTINPAALRNWPLKD
jgi:hypothetical protein